MFPGLHPIEFLDLFFRREIRKVLQPLTQHLLPLRRQFLKCRIVLQSFFLLVRRQVFVAPQPVAGMAAGLALSLRLRGTHFSLRSRGAHLWLMLFWLSLLWLMLLGLTLSLRPLRL